MKCRSIDIGFMDCITAFSSRIALCSILVNARCELDAVPSSLSVPSDYALDLVSEELDRIVIGLNTAVDQFRDQIHAIDQEEVDQL